MVWSAAFVAGLLAVSLAAGGLPVPEGLADLDGLEEETAAAWTSR